jgi:hypothetical protein
MTISRQDIPNIVFSHHTKTLKKNQGNAHKGTDESLAAVFGYLNLAVSLTVRFWPISA